MLKVLSLVASFVSALASAQPAVPQSPCADWSDDFGVRGTSAFEGGRVVDQTMFDDGSGPALYACGVIDAAGSTVTHGIARWDGSEWSSIDGQGTFTVSSASISALAVFDAGFGPELYAGGAFTSIGGVPATNLAKWNGSQWEQVGGGYGRAVSDLIVFDDGTGAQLYVAGGAPLDASGTLFAGTVSRWSGSAWSLPFGIDPNNRVHTFALHDDGGGVDLYVGGVFTQVGLVNARGVARWDGNVWSALGSGVVGDVFALAEHDDGTGPALYAGGDFSSAGGVPATFRLARWKQNVWSSLGNGAGGVVRALASFDDGVSRRLIAGGDFTYIDDTNCRRIGSWDGSAWSELGTPSGVAFVIVSNEAAYVRSLLVADDGSGAGESLFVGGNFARAGNANATDIARWNANGWSSVGNGNGLDSAARAFATFDAGAGPELYVGGSFTRAGSATTRGVARWTGSAWAELSPSTNNTGIVDALISFDDGSGEALYVGGNMANIGGVAANGLARWDGSTWSLVGAGMPSGASISAFAVFDDGTGPALWVAGSFASAGGVPAKNIARWDGVAWSAPAEGPNGAVQTLCVHDDGSGPALYAGGYFNKTGPLFVYGIARWDGSAWSKVGTGIGGAVEALVSFDDGTGTKLYAGGEFTNTPIEGSMRIARWNGAYWDTFGLGFNSTVQALQVFDDGFGPALYAGGLFERTGTEPARGLARWNGTAWVEAAGGVDGFVMALHSFEDGTSNTARMYVGGYFVASGDVASHNVAALERACPCPRTFCVAGASSNGCVPSIGAVGIASATATSGFVVLANGVEGQRVGMMFYGLNGAQAVPWGTTSSVLCVRPPHQRTATISSGGTSGACDGALALDWNAYRATNPSALGQPIAAGTVVWSQGWYRDPPNPKTTSLTNAIEFVVCP